jgi:hypothetical protein
MKKLLIPLMLTAAAFSFAARAESSAIAFYPGVMLDRVNLSANWPEGHKSGTDLIVGAEYYSTGIKFRPRAEARWLSWGRDVGSFGKLDGWSIGAGVGFDAMGNDTISPYAIIQSRELAGRRTTGFGVGLDYRLADGVVCRLEYQQAGEMTAGATESIKPRSFGIGLVWR